MNHTFGSHLERFAHAVDIVSQSVFDNVLDLVSVYLREKLSIQYCELLVPIRVFKEPGLQSEWHPGGDNWANRIRNEQGEYVGQISYAYDQQKYAWIVAIHKGELEGAVCEDLWDRGTPSEKIPPFVHLNNNPIRTSIICPLKAGEQRLGILNFESTLHLRPTKSLTDEIRRIADSIAFLFILKRVNKFQCDSTGKALSSLSEFTKLPLTDRDRVFVASSAKGDASVTDTITSTLKQFDVEVFYWKLNTRMGNIPEHIWTNLSSAVLGICYFSEPTEVSQHKYSDNANVLFEAGMMHAFSRIGDVMKGWIPIREADSPPSPFDFSSENIITVPRNSISQVNRENLSKTLNDLLTSAGLLYRNQA